MNELIEKLKERQAEVASAKAEILSVDVEVEVAKKIEALKEEIRAEIISNRDAKIADLELEEKALGRLIDKEVAKVESEAVVEEVVEGE